MSIKAQVVTAMRWTAAARMASQAVTWAITLVVIRLLNPEDYGLMSMATAVIGLCYLVNELGVVPALIQTKDVDDHLIRQAFGAILLSNLAIFAVLMLGGPVYAAFFGEDRLVPILLVLGAGLLVMSCGEVPRALLMRDIEFKEISIVEFVTTVTSGFVTLGLALAGAGVWALVLGNLARMIIRTAGIIILTRFRVLPVFRFAGLGRLMSFGVKVSTQRIIWYLGSQLDVILIGKLLGNAPLGVYSVGYHLASLPMQRVMGLLNQVAFPAYSRIQDDLPRVKASYLETMKLVSLAFFPVMWGLSAVSEEVVAVVLGPKWHDAGLVLQAICLVIPFRINSFLLAPMIDALGRPGRNILNTSLGLPLLACGIVIGLQWGLDGVAVGVSIAFLCSALLIAALSVPLIGASLLELAGAMAPALLSGSAMLAAVLTAKTMLLADLPPAMRLGLMIAIGAATYAGCAYAVNREAVKRAWALIMTRG